MERFSCGLEEDMKQTRSFVGMECIRRPYPALNRRKFIGHSSSAAALATTQTHPALALRTPSVVSQPNLLFIIADDLMVRTIRSINNPEVHTPHIDRLVAKGAHFTHCFHQGSWTGAVYGASRTMLNTGLSCFKASKIEMRDQSNNTIPSCVRPHSLCM